MNKTLALKSRLNSSFGVLSLFSIVSVLISIFSVVLYVVVQVVVDGLQLGDFVYNRLYFHLQFIIPQILLPVLTALVGCLIPIVGRFKFSDCVKNKKVPVKYFILCVFIFWGLSTVSSYVSYAISDLLILIGVPVTDVNSVLPVPDGIFEIFLFVLVMAVLPAICEELIYRGFLLGGLAQYGKVGAIVVSSIAFGLMHATVQQIPFAFFIGLFLGYVTLRFESLVLPIFLHFINNFTACVILIMQMHMDVELVNDIAFCFDIFLVAVSVLSLLIFIVLTVHEKKEKEIENQSAICDSSENSADDICFEVNIHETKVDFLTAVTHSWGFWLFTGIYLFTTVANIFVLSPR